jgi:hypothetical protein
MTTMFEQLSQTTYRVGVMSSGSKEVNQDAENLMKQLNQIAGITVKEANDEGFHTDIIMGVYHYGINLDMLDSNRKLASMENETIEKAVISYNNQENVKHFVEYLKNQPMDSISELSTIERNIGFLASLFMVIAVLHAGLYIRDRQEGLLVRYCYSPKSKKSYVMGNYIYIFLITFLQVGVSLVILNLIQKNQVDILQFVWIVSFLALITSIFAILISSISKSEVQASITASSITAILTLLSGTFISVSQLPTFLQYVGVVNPIRWCIELSKIIL